MQENPAGSTILPVAKLELQCARSQGLGVPNTRFCKAQETYLMRVKFAYAVSIAAAVAMLTACGKKQDGEAGAGASAAVVASAPATEEATVLRDGPAAPLAGGNAHMGKENGNGARLAGEEIKKQGLTNDGH